MPYDREEHVIGYGKELSYADTLSGTYTPVFGTIDVTLPERELGRAEVTNDDSPDFHKDYTPGLFEPGVVSFSYRYGKTQFAALETIFQLANAAGTRANATKFWKCTLPDGSVGSFKGFLTKHDLPVEGLEDSPVVEAEIQVVGKMAYATEGEEEE